MNIHLPIGRKPIALLSAMVLLGSVVLSTGTAYAQSSWNPTLLVNTEAFQTIDNGDGSSDIELRFGGSTETIKFLTTNTFQFSHRISVLGTISGSSLNVDQNTTIGGTLSVTGATTLSSTLNVTGVGTFSDNVNVSGILSGQTLRVGVGGADIHGVLNASGAIQTDDNLTINADQTAADAVFTFGSDGTNETLTFQNTADQFQFSDDVSVVGFLSGSALRVDGLAEIHGELSASGAIRTDSNLTINDDQTAADAVITFGSDGTNETVTFQNSADQFQVSDDLSVVGYLSGSALRVDGLAEVHGALTVTGAITTDSDLTLNADQTAANVTLTFGSDGTNETITWDNTADKWSFSDDIQVLGNISGSTLTVDGDVTIHSVTYDFPTTQGAASTVLTNDGSGNLSWASSTVGDGSGGILSYHPEYPNAIYFSSGSTSIGQLVLSGGTVDLDNSYVWTSTQGTIQDYWVSVRVRLPDNYGSWDPVAPIQFRYKTGAASAATNHLTVRMKDTAGADVTLSSGDGLASTSWATANITGPEGAGTWTTGGYFTVYVKLATTSSGNAAASYLDFNFETSTP